VVEHLPSTIEALGLTLTSKIINLMDMRSVPGTVRSLAGEGQRKGTESGWCDQWMLDFLFGFDYSGVC
jgi:hypothetical protein